MAKKSQNETDRWMKAESLKCFQKYFAGCETYDRDMFTVPVAYISKDLWKRCIADTFTPAELDEAEVVANSDLVGETLFRLTSRGKTARRGRDLVNAVVGAAVKKYAAAATDGEPFRRRFDELADTLRLSAAERRVLFVCASGVIDEMFNSTPSVRRADRRQNRLDDIARATGSTNSELKSMIRPDSRLVRYGCIDDDFDVNPRVVDFLAGLVDDAFISAYYSRWKGEALPLSFFSKKMRQAADRIGRLVKAAKGKSPVNVLLYGVPGTGKTSLAHTLARELGRECYFVSQSDTSRNGGFCRTPPAYRYGAVNLAQDRLDPEKSILVVDEADDLLNPRGDKGLLNSVMDTVKVPVIWISNSSRGELDESNCRRFDTSVEFGRLKGRERLMVWKNCLTKLNAESMFSEDQLVGFARRYPVSAGDIAQVMANVLRQKPRTAKKGAALVEEYMAPHCELLGIKLEKSDAKPSPKNAATRDYSLDGLNVKGDVKPADIVAAVKKFRATRRDDCPDRPRMTILLSGAPGTGKTEFCRYLAGELGEELVTFMGSDLLDKYVGESEKRIAAAFAKCSPQHDDEEEDQDDLEVQPKNKILFFDEIDGMVQSRSMARASWEVSKVNEILHQMENFDGVFIGATNFSTNLDEAIMRRFTYKLEFGWLENEGKRLFFEKYFKTSLADDEKAELDGIQQLSVADFATVRRKFYYLDRPVTNQERLNALREEVAVKAKEAQGARIGF